MLRLTIIIKHEFADQVLGILAINGYESVAVYDNNDYLDLLKNHKSWDYADEELLNADSHTRIEVFSTFEDDANALKDLERAQDLIKNGFMAEFKVDNANQAEWQQAYFDSIQPIKVGNFTVLPTDSDECAKADENSLCIIRGMAFGTGSHESTQICLELMQKIQLKDAVVLDVGCGSGILGLAALKMGANRAYLLDNDSCCVEAAQRNAELNGLLQRSEIFENSLLDGITIKADLICANLTADLLIDLSQSLKHNLKDNGYIVVSGILNDRLCHTLSVLKERGLQAISVASRGEWSGALLCMGGT